MFPTRKTPRRSITLTGTNPPTSWSLTPAKRRFVLQANLRRRRRRKQTTTTNQVSQPNGPLSTLWREGFYISATKTHDRRKDTASEFAEKIIFLANPGCAR